MRKVSLLILFVLLWLAGWSQKTDIDGIDIYEFVEIVPNDYLDNKHSTIQFTFQFHTEKELDENDLLELFALSRGDGRASFELKFLNPWKEKFSKTIKEYVLVESSSYRILDTNSIGKIINSLASKIYLKITNNNTFEIRYQLLKNDFTFISFTTNYFRGKEYFIHEVAIIGEPWTEKKEYYYGLTSENETIPFEILEESYQKELLTKYYKILLERTKEINEYLKDPSRLNPESN